MTEDEARRVELVRAIETEDRDYLLLTREDRQQAEAHALSGLGATLDRRTERRFIARRADFATARLETRHPGIAAMLAPRPWRRWLGLALPLLALGAGFLANEFGTDRRLELLAVPLLGTIAWNLFVYLWVIGAAFTRGHKAPTGAVAWLAGLGRRDFDGATALGRAVARFRLSWAKVSAPLAGARFARTLHLGAAMFAAGLIGGIYLRALVIEYRAGWESTFLGAHAVHALLSVMLGPASLVTGVAIPPVAQIAAMRWSEGAIGVETGGVNAGPWIHLYSTTIIGLVVLPRVLLALWQGARALRLERHFPIAGQEDFYVRRLMRAAGGAPGSARVTPYAYRPDEDTRRRLAGALRAALGDGAQVRFDDPVEYGAEDRWLAQHAVDPADDYHILLFTLSTTPENENHGAMTANLKAQIAREQSGTVLAALIDETPFRAHFAGQTGLDERIDTRVAAWRRVLSGAGIVPLALNLSHDVDDALAQRIESGLLPDGAMRG